MKYYQLTKDLPTFKKGEQFFVNDYGQLISCAHEGVVAYSAHTLKRFPDVLKDWFVEVPAPVRDSKTKQAFMEYISDHKEQKEAFKESKLAYIGGIILLVVIGIMIVGFMIATVIVVGRTIEDKNKTTQYNLNCLTEPVEGPLTECRE